MNADQGADRDYTHRDRRAQRDVARSLGTLSAVIVVLTALALWVPLPYVGLAAVVALAIAGAVYVGWSDRLLATYSRDLLSAREGKVTDGFLRAEVASSVGLDRDGGGPRVPSPHSRRRSPEVRSGEDTKDRGAR